MSVPGSAFGAPEDPMPALDDRALRAIADFIGSARFEAFVFHAYEVTP